MNPLRTATHLHCTAMHPPCTATHLLPTAMNALRMATHVQYHEGDTIHIEHFTDARNPRRRRAVWVSTCVRGAFTRRRDRLTGKHPLAWFLNPSISPVHPYAAGGVGDAGAGERGRLMNVRRRRHEPARCARTRPAAWRCRCGRARPAAWRRRTAACICPVGPDASGRIDDERRDSPPAC